MSGIDYVLIGKRVKETRTQMRISQAALAEMTGLSVSYISHIETAHKRASLTSLISIANAAGISVDELLYGNQESYTMDYHLDIAFLVESCNTLEKRLLYLVIEAIIAILRDNGWFLEKK